MNSNGVLFQENGMHDIMGREKWQGSIEQTIKVSHRIYRYDNFLAIFMNLWTFGNASIDKLSPRDVRCLMSSYFDVA